MSDQGRWRTIVRLGFAATAALLLLSLAPRHAGVRAAPTYSYGEALQKSLLFYEAQASGRLPAWNRVTWRDDATVNDGQSEGVDLSGGWYDAGDHVKFGFPMAAAVTTLAWGGVDYRDAYAQSGQLQHLLNNLRWANDYFINAHPAPNVLYGHVGDGNADHAYWGSPETVDAKGMPRPVYKITASCPGTDLAGETAAAMAASSMVFRQNGDAAYADTLLTHARQLFTFADSTKGTSGQDTAYVKCIPAASNFYNSIGEGGQAPGATKMYWDELVWSAVWLYRATGEQSYLDYAKTLYPRMGSEPDPGNNAAQVPVYSFGFGWNDKQYAVYALMARLTGEQQYKDDTQRYLDYWTVGYKGKKGQTTPGGLAYIFYWASLRMAANTAFVAMNYADYLGEGDPLYSRYNDFGRRQIDYALGDNPRGGSYMVGFGVKSPRNVHHRGAHGAWTNAGPDSEPAISRHILYGALAGGPDATDAWADSRGDYVKNEVALDFNSGITSSLARLYGRYGGEPLANFPVPETPDGPEIYIEPKITQGAGATSIQLYIINKSAWPARVIDKGSIRYYFTLEPGVSPSQVSASSPYTQCRPPTGPTQVSGSLYYVTVDCTGTLSYPGGQSEFRREVQLRIASTGAWDPANDWSAQGAQNMVLYSNGVRIWGNEPGEVPVPSATPTSGPTSTARPTNTPTAGPSRTPTSTARPTNTPTAGPSRTPTGTARPTNTPTAGPSRTPTSTARPTNTPTAGPSSTPTPTQGSGGACQVVYRLNQWSTGFTAEVTVKNTGTSTISGWTLAWTFGGNQQISNAWNATVAQSGASVTASNLSWNGTLAPGGTASFGFQASYSGTNAVPSSFTLNGAPCTVAP